MGGEGVRTDKCFKSPTLEAHSPKCKVRPRFWISPAVFSYLGARIGKAQIGHRTGKNFTDLG